jgi:CYTH domain-containing protein
MKYARIERERRFLVRELPAELLAADYQRILDCYIPGTRLRLRRIESPAGETLALKLTQKYPADEQAGADTVITNLYLNEVEYALLDVLDGLPLSKRRYAYQYSDYRYSIDIFEGQLLGLILCEVEAESSKRLAAVPAPPFAIREVTDDPFFTGGNLVNVTNGEIRARLVELESKRA